MGNRTEVGQLSAATGDGDGEPESEHRSIWLLVRINEWFRTARSMEWQSGR